MNDLPLDAVLWADETLVVANKPAGMLVIPGAYGDEPTLVRALEPQFGRVWVVHRLDRDTSGVIVLARTADAHRSLNGQFQEREVHKVYHALVSGVPAWVKQEISLPLRRDGDRRHRTVVDRERGKRAHTQLCVLESFACCTLVEASPSTGRTHQIRAHLSTLGLPLVGDPLYRVPRGQTAAPGAEIPEALLGLIGRTALHALALTLHHPATGTVVTYRAPYPADLGAALEWLRAHHD